MTDQVRISRREMLKYLGVASVGIAGGSLLSGCGPTPQPAAPAGPPPTPEVGASGKPLTIATVGGTWKDWQNECVAVPFTEETGVDVLWDVQVGQSILAMMVAAKKANQTPIHHISKIDELDVQFVDAQGLTSPLDKNIVTNWENIHPKFRSDSWMTNHFAVYCMTWNTDKVKKEVTSWFDMWDDTFKGKIAIPIYEWVGFRYLSALNTILGGTPDNVDPFFDKMKEVVDTLEPKFMNSVEHGNQLFENEEIWIAPFWDGRSRNLQDKGLPIAYIFPEEGAIANGSGFVINRDLAENYREANLFMNKLGDPESQICFNKKINYPPTNIKAVLPPDLERIKVSKEDMDNMVVVDWPGYTARKGEYLDRWNREIAKGG